VLARGARDRPRRNRITQRCTREKFALYRCSSAELSFLLRQRCGRSNDLGTTIKYLRKTTTGDAGNGLGATAKYPRRTMGAAAGNGLGLRPSYLRGAVGNGRVQRCSTFDAQRAPPRAAAWAPR
jgi:hypothetical protein